MSPAYLAWLNLVRRPLPTAIAIISIAIAVACSGILLRLNLLSQNRFAGLADGGDALIGAKAGGIEIILSALNGEGEYPGFIPYKLYESLKSEQAVNFSDGSQTKPGFVKSVTPFLYFGRVGLGRAIATDETFFDRAGKQISFSEGAWAQADNEMVVGDQIAALHNWHLGDRILIQPWVGSDSGELAEFTIKGRLAPTHSNWDRHVYARIPAAHKILATLDLREQSIWGPGVLNYFLLELNPGGFASLAALINRRTVAEAILIDTQKERLQNLTGTGTRLGLFVTILVLLLGGLSVAAMLITRFEAMAAQLAVLRAIGYSRGAIGQWLLWEGFFLGATATLIGLNVDAAGFNFVRDLLGAALPPREMNPSSLLSSGPVWITAILATVASVFIPLYRVYRQDVHRALRS